MTSSRSPWSQSIPEEVEQGRLDDALARLSASAATSDDARTLAFLYSQRGDFDRAVELLRAPQWTSALDAYGLTLRGNALWRAGHLHDALEDYDAAQRVATSAAQGNALRTEMTVLRDEIEVMARVDRSLHRLDIAYALALAAISLMIIEVHRRLLRRLRT